MDLAVAALPWVVLGILLAGFALADELPHPGVRRAVVGASLVLVGVAAVAVRARPGAASLTTVLTAAGPLVFLLIHHGLRVAFRRLKGQEPALVSHATVGDAAPRRLLYRPEVSRRVTWWDYLYSFLVGVAMLVASAPALAELIARSG